MLTLLAFLVAIGVLVTFHELGHYWVARLCGVKVLRFSIGFGKPLLTWRTRSTEWVICPIPLGGYVRMLDEREGDVSPDERHLAFNTQSVYKRMAIVVAGPLANLVLAVLLYWVVLGQGVTELKPVIGTVVEQTPAAQAGFVPGERVVSVAGAKVDNWQELRLALVDAGLADDGTVSVQVQGADGKARTRRLDVAHFGPKAVEAMQQGSVGLMPARFLPVLGGLEKGGVAERAGLKVGDKLVSVDGRTLPGWEEWVAMVRNNPGRDLALVVERAGKPLAVKLRPEGHRQGDEWVGRIGAAPQPDESWSKQLLIHRSLGVGEAGLAAFKRTTDTAWMSLKFLGRMLVGGASLDNLSGPLTIATIAGQTAREGLTTYLEFLALISVSIGVLNLLPVPVLDGGHLMYYVAELLRGKPVGARAQLIGQKIGFILLASLMALALLNDFSRLFGG